MYEFKLQSNAMINPDITPPVNKKHGTDLRTRFLHEAFFHKVPGQFGHQLEGRTKK